MKHDDYNAEKLTLNRQKGGGSNSNWLISQNETVYYLKENLHRFCVFDDTKQDNDCELKEGFFLEGLIAF